jgi:hypothetical protein
MTNQISAAHPRRSPEQTQQDRLEFDAPRWTVAIQILIAGSNNDYARSITVISPPHPEQIGGYFALPVGWSRHAAD